MIDFSFDPGNALAGLPETSQIGALLNDVAPPPGQSGPNLAATKVHHFFTGANWRNREVRPAPPPGPAPTGPRVLAALQLGQFLRAVNWKNAVAAPSLPLAGGAEAEPRDHPMSAEKVLQEFVWD